MSKDEIIKKLEEENRKLCEEKEQLEKKVKDLEKENKNLEQQLTFFKNPHTPPSKQIFKKKIPSLSKKIGAPLGHKGATRENFEPTDFVNHFLKRCPQCNDILCKPFDIEERIIEEIPEPQQIKVTKHIIGFYNCKNCGIVTAKTDLPEEGRFGKNILAHTTLMKYDDRLPARKVANTLNRTFLFEITHPGILNIVQRVVKKVQGSEEH